ncbi:hypothetical protein AKJ09_02204 [Labilithrix luteola]|uniref:DUF4440 domain-containing protein n=1 Tax=Labilithrix luteola TaxID=1391654 RepID=A0A0K1PPS3_9BACT|nr:SgcJ/EcaC family oxidoreductase [Labilithrix luteola]AKU95540.1 hypothetical protein AKJ09_02204 [Labilithrix luteola]
MREVAMNVGMIGIEDVIERYVQTWQRDDMDAWGELFTEDCDFVAWAGQWWKTRRENVDAHKCVHASVAKQRQNYELEIAKVDMLCSELALVHARWSWREFRAMPDAPSDDRSGIVTMVMMKTEAGWRIRASHNARVTP